MEKRAPQELSTALAPSLFDGLDLLRHRLPGAARFRQSCCSMVAVGAGDLELCLEYLVAPQTFRQLEGRLNDVCDRSEFPAERPLLADNSASEPKRILTCGPIFLAAYRGLDLVRAIAR